MQNPMDPNQAACASRRDALKLGLSAGIGVAVVMVAGSAFSQSTKLSKESVKYTDAAKVQGKDCDDCSQYIPGKTAADPGTCKIVEGPINAHGHCIAFSPKPRS
ncbi:MAG TPA: hypothetical protein VJ598_06445 [Albitalea sp.]|nr:hypothetical protein [Albitalea sp.]